MDKLLAKDSGETLFDHSINVVKVAKLVCEGLPVPVDQQEKLVNILLQLAALHDVGKAAKGFQEVLRGKAERWNRHEILSVAIASQIALEVTCEGLLAIITHHKSIPEGNITHKEKCLPDNELPFLEPNVFFNMVADLKQNEVLLRELLSDLDKEIKANWRIEYLNFNSMNLDKLGQEWLERRKGIGQQSRIKSENRKFASMLRGLLITSDHMASGHVKPIKLQSLLPFHNKVQEFEFKNKPALPFQEKCGNAIGDTILKAPTGSGKTGAILLWAEKNQTENARLFYTLPHTASINAMHQRLQKIYSNETVGVFHHKSAAYLFRMFEQECCTNKAAKMARTVNGLARELYYPIRVTTPHQILRVALQGKGWELGLVEFPNACFIFDEIHCFEPLLVGLTIATAKWLKSFGAKLLFASATIPTFLENIIKTELGIKELNVICPNPKLEGDKEVCNKVRHKIIVHPGSLVDTLPIIINQIKSSNQTVLIVCNHVATSQQVWKRLQKEFGEQVMLLHSRFNSLDRTRVEETITGNNPPRILVATQAIEVSLDLDYDRAYTEPAPADALGQRLGRVNRKGSRSEPAPIIVFEEPSNGHLYDKNVTQKTIQLLKQINNLTEQELTEIVNTVYQDGYTGKSLEEYQRGLHNSIISKFDANILAGSHKAWVEDVIEKSDGQIEVLPVEGTDVNGLHINIFQEFKQHFNEKNYLQAKRLLVPIRIGQWWKLKNDSVVYYCEEIREWITTLSYSSHEGLDLSKQIESIL